MAAEEEEDDDVERDPGGLVSGSVFDGDVNGEESTRDERDARDDIDDGDDETIGFLHPDAGCFVFVATMPCRAACVCARL